jgi:hypothetical protein
VIIDTTIEDEPFIDEGDGPVYESGATLTVEPWSLVLLQRTGWRETRARKPPA